MNRNILFLVLVSFSTLANSAILCPNGIVRKFAHPNEAGKYFECKDGTLEEIRCPGSQVFQKDLKGCVERNFRKAKNEGDDDISVVCKLSEDGHVVFVPHPYNCQKFFICVDTVAVAMDCPGGLYFDNNLHVCNYPEDTQCIPTPRPTTTEAETTPDPTTAAPTTTEEEETTQEPTTAAPTTTTTEAETTQEPTTAAPTTTTTEAETTPDPTTAAPTTTEAETTQEPTTAAPTTTEAETTQEQTTAASTTTTTEPFTVTCTFSPDGRPVYIRHPFDCSKYYECDGLTPYLFQCPADLYFDLTLNVCNYPDQVDCESKPQP